MNQLKILKQLKNKNIFFYFFLIIYNLISFIFWEYSYKQIK